MKKTTDISKIKSIKDMKKTIKKIKIESVSVDKSLVKFSVNLDENKVNAERQDRVKVIMNQLSRGVAFVNIDEQYDFENQKINRINKNQVTIKVHSHDILTIEDVKKMHELINEFLEVRIVDRWEVNFSMSNHEAMIHIIMDIGLEKNTEQEEFEMK